jgi:hypothetical protein
MDVWDKFAICCTVFGWLALSLIAATVGKAIWLVWTM